MSGHKKFNDLTADFSPERRARVEAIKADLTADLSYQDAKEIIAQAIHSVSGGNLEALKERGLEICCERLVSWKQDGEKSMTINWGGLIPQGFVPVSVFVPLEQS